MTLIILFDPTILIILSIIVGGLPGALLGGIVAWRRRPFYGIILGWMGGLLGVVISQLLFNLAVSFLPHHEVRDVFGPAWVADYPSEKVLLTLRIGSALLGSAVLGWFFGFVISRWK